MIQGMSAALSGIRAYTNQTRITANNLANINTPGFRASRAVQESVPQGGVTISSIQSTGGAGTPIHTGSTFDMAISGDGYFKVTTPDGRTAYTRSGNFRPNSEGKLADPSGAVLQPGIKIPGDATAVAIGRDGSVTASINGERQTIGQIEITKFNNSGGLENGGNHYYETAASGQPVSGVPGSGGFGEIVPTSLESSNVEIEEQMVSLMQAENGFSAQVSVIQTADEMLGAVLDIKA